MSIASAALSSFLPTPSASSLSSDAKKAFIFPREYYFPPFFTLQPNTNTLSAQSKKWSSLCQAYCRHFRLFKISLIDATSTPLFHNDEINRRLELSDAREMVEYMRREGRAEWIGGKGKDTEGRDVAWIWWRNPEEWGALIADWVEDTGQKNTVLTLYELTESDSTISQDFHGMDPELLQRALGTLVKRGKAQVFGHEDQQGVKFY